MKGFNEFRRHLLLMVESPSAAGSITLRGASEAPVVKDSVLNFHLSAIEVCRYPNVYTAWRNHHHRNIDFYSILYSILKIRKWNHRMDQVRKNLESVLPDHQCLFVIGLSTNDVNIFHTCIVVFHRSFSSLITVWIICSSKPLEKEISTLAVLIVQSLLVGVVDEMNVYETLLSECSITGTIVSFCCGI
jgi:hypothetical protein